VPPPSLIATRQALGIALKLTFMGNNQLTDPHTLIFIVVRRARARARREEGRAANARGSRDPAAPPPSRSVSPCAAG
jgi:hypothetical protein